MSKQDNAKLQTCVLRVNIQCACDGCKQKIKKLLNKVDGVYQTSIDLDQGKVTVYGNADPNMLIKKLVKSGKHAELWGQPKGVNLISNQFKNMGFDNKGQKGGGGGGKDKQKEGKGHQQMQPIMTGFKDIKAPNKDQKSVKFSLPPGKGGGGGGGYDDEDDFDDDSFDDDEFDDEYDDDEFDDELDGYDKKPNKMMAGPGMGGNGPRGPVVLMNSKKGPGGGFEVPVQFKGKGGNSDAKSGNGGKKGGGKDGKKSKDGGKSGGFLGGLFGGGKKKSKASSPKGGKKGHDHGDGHKNGDSWDKKSGGKQFDEGKFKGGNKQTEFLDFSKPQKGGGGKSMGHNGGGGGGGAGGGGGGGGGARNMGPMGGGNPMMPQMGSYPMSQMGGYPMSQMQSTQGLPMGGHYRPQGMEQGNPYSQQQFQQQQYQQQQQQQQQYMHAMMMNQQRANMYPPQMMYGQAPPSAFGPPNAYGNDGMTHIFNDENTDSCSIM